MTKQTLTLDLGNSTLAVGVFEDARLVKHLHFPNTTPVDQLIPKILRQTGGQQAARKINAACGCSVVPDLTPPLLAELESALGLRPLLLTSTENHGLKIRYRRPAQLGADRVAAALGARKLYPGENLVIVDCGTATTLTFLTKSGELIGGAILPGLALWPAALAQATAKLPNVKLPRSSETLPAPIAKDTASAIRAGVLYGHAGAIRELAALGAREAFGPRAATREKDAPQRGRANEKGLRPRQSVTVIGTGGQAPHFAAQSCFTVMEPALTLHGLQAYAAAHA